ncbi:hypothetical protein HYG86_04505 [Alkalicella caledoniensis]|uniref:Aminoglycoside phosphotransferase domain-containing protein n=1 Tax=Alkalicella caledoniensis TaxID=2731377 RepID=A0A7G9W5X3_ALKCA|nr:hypothetical protein [Alkalicella caledoniensis]QNO14085.1 hypothetical protein HYG86_04505 [Alkalicella caledoniensis]
MSIEKVCKELCKLGLKNSESLTLNEISNKDGVMLYRFKYEGQSYVVKYFKNEKYTREIENYKILNELSIPTIKSYGYTDRSILLEDIDESHKYRLGIASDLDDVEVARALAPWYVKLHREGARYIVDKKDKFYREIDCVTKENIDKVKSLSKTQDCKVWGYILENIDFVINKVKGLDETITYNDFYWVNFVVSHDKKKALMFDYNFLGIGLRYNDIRNVLSSLSAEAGEAFLEVYGEFDHREKVVDEAMSILVSLIFAYERDVFPNWAKKSLEAVHNGQLEGAFRKVVEAFK